ncbi:MAG: metal-dependent phosphohydrolase [Hyphomicrobiales bacterium]|nr:metal-dependent phosphohydrolase [Hyphomicrobiales bacterium]
MITLPELAAEALGAFLASDMRDRFGASHVRLAEIVPFAARLALECIGNTDALYHNVEHTMLITLAGHDIFKGRVLLTHSTPDDYSNFIVACLLHDIGYVRGVVNGDGPDGWVVDAAGRKVTLPRGSSDAALAPYHVERSKLFVLERLASIEELDGPRIAGAIEHTRFPYSSPSDDPEIDEWASLLRAADLIGQLGDPHYLRKTNALYYEFEEIGLNRQLGYQSPADLFDQYPQFYWSRVSPFIQDAIRYLNVTSTGRQWISGLYSNVFRAEHELRPAGPQS